MEQLWSEQPQTQARFTPPTGDSQQRPKLREDLRRAILDGKTDRPTADLAERLLSTLRWRIDPRLSIPEPQAIDGGAIRYDWTAPGFAVRVEIEPGGHVSANSTRSDSLAVECDFFPDRAGDFAAIPADLLDALRTFHAAQIDAEGPYDGSRRP